MSPKYISILLSLLQAATLLLPAGTLSSGDALAGTSAISPQAPAVSGGPLFIENIGQFDPAARFQIWGGAQTLWLAEDAIWLSQVEGSRSKVQGWRADEPDLQPATSQAVNLRLSFPGANPHPTLEPFDRLDTHVSYFLGADPARWRTDVPVWAGVRYRDLYPGVDLVVGAWAGTSPAPLAPAQAAPAGGQPQGPPLPWRLELREGADPAAVGLRVEGADAVAVDGGTLRLTTAAGDLTLPLITAEGANSQQPAVRRLTASAFAVSAPFAPPGITPVPLDAGSLPSAIRNLQSAGPLYATFLGGSREDYVHDDAVDAAGSAYVIGSTNSSDFPTTPGAFDTSYGGSDAFVVKLDLALNINIFGVVWHDANGDGIRAPAEAGIPGVQVCAEPLSHLSPRCATSGEDGVFQIEVAAAGTYLVAPSPAPAGMQLTTQGFRLPVIVRAGQQAWNINFGYR